MAQQEWISAGQLNAILLNMMIAVNILVPATVVTAGRDAWLGAIALNAGQHLLLWCGLSLALRFPGLTLVQICRAILGRFGGTILALLYTLFFLYYGSAVLRSFADFLISSVMPETPIGAVLLPLGLLAAYAVRHGIETLGRFSQVILPVLVGWLLLMLPLLAQGVQLERLLPILEEGFAPLIGSFQYASTQFAETPFLPTLTAMVSDRCGLRGRMHTMLLLHLGVNLVMSAALVAVMGVHNAATANYPGFILIRQIDVADFIQRIEALFMTVIVLGYFVRAAFYLHAASFTLAEILGLPDPRPLVLPLAPALVSLATLIAVSQQDYKTTVIPLVEIPLTWLTGLLLPLALLLLDSLRRALRPGHPQQGCSPP